MDNIFYAGSEELVRTLLVGVLGYGILIGVLRISGKRTLAKMNAFDLIVTISLGSILATLTLSHEIALFEGVVAFSLLVALQFIVTWSGVRVPWIHTLVTGEPQLLLIRGMFVHSSMYRARVTENDIRAAIRSAGLSNMNSVEAVVLETDGTFSVVQERCTEESGSLADVRGMHTVRRC